MATDRINLATEKMQALLSRPWVRYGFISEVTLKRLETLGYVRVRIGDRGRINGTVCATELGRQRFKEVLRNRGVGERIHRATAKELPNLDGPPTLRSERVRDAAKHAHFSGLTGHPYAVYARGARRPTLAELQDNLRDVDAKLGAMMFASAAEIEAARTARAGIRSAIAWLQEVDARVAQ